MSTRHRTEPCSLGYHEVCSAHCACWCHRPPPVQRIARRLRGVPPGHGRAVAEHEPGASRDVTAADGSGR